ncbi:MAG: hypothetical protein KDI19_00125 [Pseudomonadales bacterium]|nr:hypothetical protein [Pseudomonadales bacterium]
MEGILALSIPIVFVITVGLVTRWISDNRVRRELITANAPAEVVAGLMKRPPENVESSLKWGIVSMAIGVALAIIHVAGLDADDPLSFGIVFFCGGAALLAFYFLMSNRHAGRESF